MKSVLAVCLVAVMALAFVATPADARFHGGRERLATLNQLEQGITTLEAQGAIQPAKAAELKQVVTTLKTSAPNITRDLQTLQRLQQELKAAGTSSSVLDQTIAFVEQLRTMYTHVRDDHGGRWE